MKRLFFGLPLLFSLASCSSEPEAEMEPDYENMVRVDEADEDWMSDEEKDRKVIATDRPDPQELLMIESEAPQ